MIYHYYKINHTLDRLFPKKSNTYGAILSDYNVRQTSPELNEISM